MYSDGFKYWLAYRKNNTSYYRCSRYKTKCPGRCVLEDGVIRNTTAHDHRPEPDRVLVEKFRKTLTHRAANESIDLYAIYWDEASQRHSDAALMYPYAAAESAMRKARRKQLPPVPNTMKELGDVLTSSTLFRIHSGPNKDEFYQTTLVLEGGTCLFFTHLKTLKKIGRIEELHVDASIDVTPTKAPIYHLLTVHSVQSYTSIPIMYVVMTAKSQAMFAAVFAYIREHYAAYIKPSVIMTNYDVSMQSALTFTFPEATIKGYWFHYTDAVLKYVKHLELQRETARGHGSSYLRMLMVLPLLPAEYMAPGLEALRKWAREKKILSPQMTMLCAYVEQYWLRPVGADKISVFGLTHSIYNHIQTFNKDLNTSLGTPNPTIWHMLECITYVATRTYVKVKKRKTDSTQPIKETSPPKKGQQVRGAIINDATQLWIRTPVHLRSPLHFLQLSSHCINDTIYYASLEELKNVKKGDGSASKRSLSPLPPLPTLPSPPPTAAPPMSQSQSVPALQTQSITRPKNLLIDRCKSTITAQEHCVISGAPRFQVITKTSTLQNAPQSFQILQAKPRNFILNPNGALTYASAAAAAVQQPLKRISSDPPPLAFFPKVKVTTAKKRVFSSEPPPLVPIRSS